MAQFAVAIVNNRIFACFTCDLRRMRETVNKTDYDAISRKHFERSYFPQEKMSFGNSDALFPPADLAKKISAEYEGQCKLLCYGSYPTWKEIQDRLFSLRELL